MVRNVEVIGTTEKKSTDPGRSTIFGDHFQLLVSESIAFNIPAAVATAQFLFGVHLAATILAAHACDALSNPAENHDKVEDDHDDNEGAYAFVD